jgi:hypothetical protein
VKYFPIFQELQKVNKERKEPSEATEDQVKKKNEKLGAKKKAKTIGLR